MVEMHHFFPMLLLKNIGTLYWIVLFLKCTRHPEGNGGARDPILDRKGKALRCPKRKIHLQILVSAYIDCFVTVLVASIV